MSGGGMPTLRQVQYDEAAAARLVANCQERLAELEAEQARLTKGANLARDGWEGGRRDQFEEDFDDLARQRRNIGDQLRAVVALIAAQLADVAARNLAYRIQYAAEMAAWHAEQARQAEAAAAAQNKNKALR